MSPKRKHHQNANVTKTQISQKWKYHKNFSTVQFQSMGSEGSKSSQCSPGRSNIEKPVSWNAGNEEVQKKLEGYQFKKVACWARALEGKAGIETGINCHFLYGLFIHSGRVFGSIFTLGLGEISRATVGGTNHWALVAWGTLADKPVRATCLVGLFGPKPA